MSGIRSLTRDPDTQWQRLVEDNLMSLGGTSSGFSATHGFIVNDMAREKMKTSPLHTKCVVKRESSNNAHLSSSFVYRDSSSRLEKDRANGKRKEQEVKDDNSSKCYSKNSLPPVGYAKINGDMLMTAMATDENLANLEICSEERRAADHPDDNHFINERRREHYSGKLRNTSHGYKLKYNSNRKQSRLPGGFKKRSIPPQQSERGTGLFEEPLEAGVWSTSRHWKSSNTAENYAMHKITWKSRQHLDRKTEIKSESEQSLNSSIECDRLHGDICEGLRMNNSSVKSQTPRRKRKRRGLRKTTSKVYWNDSLNDPVTSYKETKFTETQLSLSGPYMANNNCNEIIGDSLPSPSPHKVGSCEEQRKMIDIKDYDQNGETMKRNDQLQTFVLTSPMVSKKEVVLNGKMFKFFFNRLDKGAGDDCVFQGQNLLQTQSYNIRAWDNFFDSNGRVDSQEFCHFVTGPCNDYRGHNCGFCYEEEGPGTLFNKYHYQPAIPSCKSSPQRQTWQRTASWSVDNVVINWSTCRRISKSEKIRKEKKREKPCGPIASRKTGSKWRYVSGSLVREKSCLLKKDIDDVRRLSPHTPTDIKAETTLDKVHAGNGHFGFDLDINSGRRPTTISLSETSLLTFSNWSGEKYNEMFSYIRRFDLRMTKVDSNKEIFLQFSNASYADNVIYSSWTHGSFMDSIERENIAKCSRHPQSSGEMQAALRNRESNSVSTQSLLSRISCRSVERQSDYMERKDRKIDKTETICFDEEKALTKNTSKHTPVGQGGAISEDFESLDNSEYELLPSASTCFSRWKTSEVHERQPKTIEVDCQTTTDAASGYPVSHCEFFENKTNQTKDKRAFDGSKNNPPCEKSIENLIDHVHISKDEDRNSKLTISRTTNVTWGNGKLQVNEKKPDIICERTFLTSEDRSLSSLNKEVNNDTFDFSRNKIDNEAFSRFSFPKDDKRGANNNKNDDNIEMKDSIGSQIGTARNDLFEASRHIPSYFIMMGEKNCKISEDKLSADESKVNEKDEGESEVPIRYDAFLNSPHREEEINIISLNKELIESGVKKEPFENITSWNQQLDEYIPLPQGRDTYQISTQTVQPNVRHYLDDVRKGDVHKVVNGHSSVRKDANVENKTGKERQTIDMKNLVRYVNNDDLHQSSLECLLEQLIQRGKIQTAGIFSLDRKVLALSKDASLSQNDVTALCDGAMGRYNGLMKITLFDEIVFTGFQWHDYTMFMGRSASTVLVSKLGVNSLVVGFSSATTSGSCMKEIMEFAQVLKGRGL